MKNYVDKIQCSGVCRTVAARRAFVMAVRATLVLATLVAFASAVDITILDRTGVKVNLQSNANGGLNLVLARRGASATIAVIGQLAGEVSSSTSSTSGSSIQFPNSVALTVTSQEITSKRSGNVITFTWIAPNSTELRDCVDLGTHHWYGGPEQKRQYWPIERLVFSEYSYVTKEADNCGVAERYWLNSEGIFYYFDKKVPLFVDQRNLERNGACFIASIKSPYSSKRTRNVLIYSVGIFDDVRQAHEYAVEAYLKKPTGIPNEQMVTYPIWSTWAKYKSAIDHDIVMEFADQIASHGFTNRSQYEIDDLWEICYGSETVDVLRFPSMSSTISTLKSRGYRVTMWAHPFVNRNCEPWYTEATTNEYVVASEAGVTGTSWWNNNGTTATYIDFTKTAAKNWYINRLTTLKTQIGVDSYKFDAGESSWSPQIPVLQGDIEDQPNSITSEYVRAVSQFGNLVEVRAGFMTQDLPIFVRMIDKDSYWSFENGLPTLITTTLQMNMNGYPLVLPDMVGGNGYEGAPSKELFIRWLQANTFMPSIQFSYVPWDYDEETVTISKKFVDLHEKYAPAVIAAFRRAVEDGSPVNPPVWWIAPNDTEAHPIWDQYLLGETILVAPVVLANTVTRNIYLPAGKWMEQGDPEQVIEGPVWLIEYPAPLDVLPFFVLSSSSQAFTSIALVLLCLLANIVY